jgi:hypothetical protein
MSTGPTNHCLNYYIFTYANTAEQRLGARNLKDEHSRQDYLFVPNAALKDR